MMCSFLPQLAAAATLACANLTGGGLAAPGDTTFYRGGQVWTGTAFEARDMAVRNGRFVDPGEPASGERTVALNGRFVVPAYANAHAHVTNATPASNAHYLENGVFYVWNPNTIVPNEAARAFHRRTDTYDVARSMGGITEPGGHPEALYVRVLGPRIYPGRAREDFLGDAFHYGATHTEIDAALDRLVAQGADFVKSYLLHSEEYDARRDNDAYYGHRGINPANAAYLVEAARRRGLPTAFHVETVHDLVTAAESGAAMAAHLPGYTPVDSAEELESRRLDPEAARRVAASGILLVPTYNIIAGYSHGEQSEERRRLAVLHRSLQADNLRLLREAGAVLLIGTDLSGEVFTEAEHLDALDVFRPQQLLQMVVGTGPRLFTNRRIGCFDIGCEADFLVLRDNPLADIRALRSIETRIKAGLLLDSFEETDAVD